MKFWLSLLPVLFLIVGISSAQAQWPSENAVAMTVETTGVYPCQYDRGEASFSLNLVLLNPVNPSFGSTGSRPVENVEGFECKIVEYGNARVVGMDFPVQALNLGTNTNLIVGYSEPVPVVTGVITILATINYVMVPGTLTPVDKSERIGTTSPLPCDEARSGFFLEPTLRPAIAGAMAYLDADDTDDPLVAAASWLGEDYPDFLVDQYVVATEHQSWGAIKSLYR